MENWKPIPGYEGIYEASDLGRIRSSPGKTTSNALYNKRVWKSRVLKTKRPISARRHDERVTLWRDGEAKDFLVARLVASAWHGSPAPGMTVNHINGDYTDNRPENLEWLSNADNVRHGFNTGLFDSMMTPVTLTDTASGNRSKYRSMSEAGQAIGRNKGYIYGLVKKNRKYATGTNGAKYSYAIGV